MNIKNKKITVVTTILWIFTAFVLCTIPTDTIPNPRLNIPHMDKLVHFVIFFVMSALLSLTFEQLTRWNLRKIYLLAILTALVYGGLLEILQHFYFNRSGDMMDLLADIAGGIAGCLCYPIIKRVLRIEN